MTAVFHMFSTSTLLNGLDTRLKLEHEGGKQNLAPVLIQEMHWNTLRLI